MKFIFLITAFIFYNGCSLRVPLSMEMSFDEKSDSVDVFYNLKRIRHLEINDLPYTFVYGNLKFLNKTKKSITYNIENYNLILEKKASDVWYDSELDVLREDVSLDGNQAVTVNVYWAFDGTIAEEQLGKLKIAPRKVNTK